MVGVGLARNSGLVAAFALVGRSGAFLTQFKNAPRSFTRIRHLRMSSANSTKRVLVPIGDGSEEIETTCVTDTLTRFGAQVVVASVMPDLLCTMSRGIKVMADVSIEDAAKEDWDLVALPGGMPGAEHLRDCEPLVGLLKKQNAEGKLYGAVCASPAVVLGSHGLAPEGVTCYPAPVFRDVLSNPVDDQVVVKGNLITSKGPGTSLKFALSSL